MAATAKVIELKGNPNKPESAEHIIIFPGGSISVCRTSNDEYWAHIEVNTSEIIEGTIRHSKIGTIVSSRLDYDNPPFDTRKIDTDKLQHIAVRIKTI